MRSVLACGILVLAGSASAQMGAYHGVAFSLKQLQLAGKVSLARQENPIRASGFPTAAEGELPEPQTKDKEFQLIRSGRTSRKGDEVTLEGGAEFLFQGYRVICGSARGNTRTKRFVLMDKVTLTGADAVVTGDQIDVDFEAKSFVSYNGESELRPQLIKGLAQDNIYLRAGKVSGTQKEVFGERCKFTTCNLKGPHFHLDADSAVVRPGKRVILRKARLNAFGRNLFTIPYLSIPLDERAYNSLPEIGQSPDEGYYIKNRYSIPVKGENTATALVDLMSKLGTGLGIDTSYRSSKLDGRTRLYGITGTSKTLSINNELRQVLSFGDLSVQNNIQQDNYLSAPGTTSISNRVQLGIRGKGSDSSRVSFFQQASRSSGFESESNNVSLSDQRRFGRLSSSLDVSWATNTSNFGSTSSSRRQVDLRWRGLQELKIGTASIDYQRQIPIGDTTGFFGSSDRTPVLTLQSDSSKLFGQNFGKKVPFRSEFSLGEFFDTQANSRIGRGTVDLNFNKPNNSKGPFGVDLSGQFKQGIYSDDTAQYVLGLNTNARYKLGKDTGINLRYSYLRPYGYTPLYIDRGGRTNYFSADLNIRPTPTLLLGAQTGYDLLRLERQEVAWQQVGLRAEYKPNDKALVRALASYDTFRSVWGSIRLDATTIVNDTYLSLGSRFDGQRHTWSNANLYVDNLRLGKVKASAVLSYNGFLKKFENQQIAFTYDLHCTEAILQIVENGTGFRSGRTISFFLRIKAFPMETPFGTGSRGQSIGTGSGREF